MNTDLPDRDLMESWLASGQTARISGLDLQPMAHPILTGTAQCIIKGQATVYFLTQPPHGNIWLLKKFAPSRRPSDDYLQRVASCLPGRFELFTCTQRRFLAAQHLDMAFSAYRDERLASWLEGTLLMPKVPGQPWASLADQLRDGEVQLPIERRLKLAMKLATCIGYLEAGKCSHRDLSSTNVFVTEQDLVYLIDLDSLFQSSLAFQPNTTVGTRGYIAPFIRSPTGDYDAKLSWYSQADRFAMAILITEILQVSDQTPIAQEDGSLFAQTQLERSDKAAFQPHVDALSSLAWDLGTLLDRALDAGSFDQCPTPAEWRAALGKASRRSSAVSTSPARWVDHSCADCSVSLRLPEDRLTMLQQKGKPVLCRSCLDAQRRAWAASEAQKDREAPAVVCEHCGKHIRRPRDRIEQLRSNGKPILCGPCLQQQLTGWKAEQTRRDLETKCASCGRCGRQFRVSRTKASNLQAVGKSLLCYECRSEVRKKKETGAPSFTRNTLLW